MARKQQRKWESGDGQKYRLVNGFAARRALKRNVKRRETSASFGETSASFFTLSRFMVLGCSLIGNVPLKRTLISHFMGIDVKREIR